MSDQGQKGGGQSPASSRTGTGKPSLDTLFDDPEGDPESSASVAAVSASVALSSRPRNSGVENSQADASRSRPSVSVPRPGASVLRPSVSVPRPDALASEDALDLEREGQSLGSSPVAGGSLRPSVPPSLPVGVALRSVGTPAPPMAVPSLRPPEAPPPPLRTSVPPPPAGFEPSSPQRWAPNSNLSTRLGLPEAAPAPVLTPAPSAANESSPTQVMAPLPAELYPVPSHAKTLPGLAPSNLSPTAESPEAAASALSHPNGAAPSGSAGIDVGNAAHARRSIARTPRLWVAAGALVVVLIAAVGLLLSRPTPGVLVISVSGPENEAVPQLSIFVDETLRCITSPCRVDGLPVGVHVLRAEAPGYLASPPQDLDLRPGTDTVHNLLLTPIRKTAKLSVRSEAPGVRVLVDGKDLGPPPVEVSDLDPGEHVVRIEGERYVPLDHTVVLAADETATVGPLQPRVRLGSLTVRAGSGAEGASVTLDGQPIPELPVTLDLDAQKPHGLVAEKPGFDRFEREISFADGNPELSIDVVLLESYAGDTSVPTSRATDAPTGKSGSAARATVATLNMNSIPTSTVLLDGKRLGQTPLVGVSTKPGVHSVTFVHPQHGRKSVQVKLVPGQNRTVSVRF